MDDIHVDIEHAHRIVLIEPLHVISNNVAF